MGDSGCRILRKWQSFSDGLFFRIRDNVSNFALNIYVTLHDVRQLINHVLINSTFLKSAFFVYI